MPRFRVEVTSHEILRRPLPVGSSADEPQTKRARANGSEHASTIEEKVLQDAYGVLDELVLDLDQAVNSQVTELESMRKEAGSSRNVDGAIAKALRLKSTAHELFWREMTYTLTGRLDVAECGTADGNGKGAANGFALMTYGMAPTLKPVFTSLQRSTSPNALIDQQLADAGVPDGIVPTRIAPATVLKEKAIRPPTLGELFPSPRNLPPLQPPKATKNTTKSNVLTFYHPEPVEKSRYRNGSYFSMNLSTGTWLDYSNATPTTHAKTKQRERAQSLAGVKPSSVELEMSEMETLFRGAFSSFAPCKDDAGAIIPSGQVSRLWWQRVGRRNFDRMVDAEVADDDGAKSAGASATPVNAEEVVRDAIDNWDDAVVDPSLDHVLGKKSAEEKEVDDLLEEVTDLIETLASHQRNRNLTLPTSQDRYSADPVNGDMLRHGSLSHQPGEEEMSTYQTLKSQLSIIINMLPPYAVARLNSDKLEELNISTKIEIRTDEYSGVMQEDEPARLARQAQQTAHAANQRVQPRSSSMSSGSPAYPPASHGYAASYAPPSHRPGPPVQQYPHTPARPQAPNMYGQRPPSTAPVSQTHPTQTRPAAAPSYRGPNGYAAAYAAPKQPVSYAPSPMQYPNSPNQQRMGPHPGYPNGPPSGAPQTHRFTPTYPGYSQHQQTHPQHMQRSPHAPHSQQPQQPPHPPSPHVPNHQPQYSQHPQQVHQPQQAPHQANFVQYPNNGAQIHRTMSPQVSQSHGFSPSPTPPLQHQLQHQNQQVHMPRPPYGGPAQSAPPSQAHHHYGGAPANMPQGIVGPSPSRGAGPIGYHTHLNESQQRQMMEQANARARAQQTATGHMNKVTQGEVVGLAGIGLGGNVDVHKIAAAKAMYMGNANAASPSPKLAMQPGPGGPHGVNMPPPSSSAMGQMPGGGGSPGPGPAGYRAHS